MHAPIVFRYASFTVFFVCSLIMTCLAGTSLSQTKALGSSSSIARVDAYLVVVGLLGLLAVLVVIPLERVRRSAFPGKLWVEVAWVIMFCVFNLSAAAAVSAIGSQDVCSSPSRDLLPTSACPTVGALQAFSWLTAFTLLFHAVFITVCARLNSARIPNIWHISMLDIQWSATAATSPVKGNDVLPTVHEKQIPVYNVGIKPLVTVQALAGSAQTDLERGSFPTKASLPTAQRTRTSDLITTPASHHATPPLYPQFLQSSTQNRPAVQQPSPAEQSASIRSLSETSSGRSSPASVTSSTTSSPMSSPYSSTGSKVLTSDAGSGRSPSSSPRTKRRPPPLNLAGLSAFNTKSQRQARA